MTKRKATVPWYRRKLIWFHAISGGLAFVMAGWSEVAGSLPLPKWIVLLLGGVLAAANVGARFLTTSTEQADTKSDDAGVDP